MRQAVTIVFGVLLFSAVLVWAAKGGILLTGCFPEACRGRQLPHTFINITLTNVQYNDAPALAHQILTVVCLTYCCTPQQHTLTPVCVL